MRAAPMILMLGLMVLPGCASDGPAPQPDPVQQGPELSRVSLVQPGMSPAQVRELLGEPALKETPAGRDGTRIWHYEAGVVVFQADRVAFRYAKPREDG